MAGERASPWCRTALADLRVQPLVQDRVAEAEQDRGERTIARRGRFSPEVPRGRPFSHHFDP
jgi:hypothetical protein